MADEHFVRTEVQGRILVESAKGASEENTPYLIGFHGYAENAERHIACLQRIPLKGALRCAVQALHPFYNRSEEVVASWMTKQDREQAIRDNLRYIDAAIQHLFDAYGQSKRLFFLGFSQGAAMAYRAAAGSSFPSRAVVSIGGDLPPELASIPLEHLPPVLVCRGDSDPYYSEEQLRLDVERLRENGADADEFTYAGTHEWTEQLESGIGAFLEGSVLDG